MKNTVIYDYEEVEYEINEIIKKSATNTYPFIEIENNWKTECDLQIRHYSIGSGIKHIVLLAAFHGAEIISTEFLLYIMNYIVENEKEFLEILKENTLDFIPIVNPEGYIITTSAIRTQIPRNMSSSDIEKICSKYLRLYKEDDDKEIAGEITDNSELKKYQSMFKEATYHDIPDKYKRVKKKIEEIYQKYKIPDGSVIAWCANANGIDLNANTKYNRSISKIENGEELYMPLRYSNIRFSEPGPINCPYDKNKGFLQEKETIFISEFLEELYNSNKLSAIFNYHSAGGLIDQRPSELKEDLKDRNINLKHKSLNNYMFAKFYQSETYKNSNNKDEKYIILKDSSVIRTLNGLYRVLYPLDMLVELSELGANPIGPYSNIENYNSIMKSNLEAIKKSISYLKFSNKISDIIYYYMEENYKGLDKDEFINKGYELVDEIFEIFEEYIQRGEDEERIISHIKKILNNG